MTTQDLLFLPETPAGASEERAPELGVVTGSPTFFSAELDALTAKINRGENLTNDERARRQGIIFNHSGKASGFCII